LVLACQGIASRPSTDAAGRIDDGPLLDAAEAEYDALITMDQNLRFQQNIRGRQLRIVLIRAARNTVPVLAPIAPAILDALGTMGPGDFRVVGV
jgi:hypothetical protein